MTIVCTRCHRPLKLPTATGMGPVCSKAARAQAPIAHERDLFGYDLERAQRAACERVAITIGMAVAAAHQEVRRAFQAARRNLLGVQP